MPPKESQAYKNVHAFQPNRGKKVKEREKSALDTAVSASLAGVCARCSEQLQWCVRAHAWPLSRVPPSPLPCSARQALCQRAPPAAGGAARRR
jgi:hypothetical protein